MTRLLFKWKDFSAKGTKRERVVQAQKKEKRKVSWGKGRKKRKASLGPTTAGPTNKALTLVSPPPVTSAALEPRGRVATSLVEWRAQCTRDL
jgi:hypothetical protein